ncbi:hypothetical protein B4915_01510 [Leucobacter massiliensis]|uniref:Uncharacterized protein n=1 Tax=Leucobacter massiliensis TaxID=1686285 RepID=A0A2S9QS04_9MICO|nr:hypothetical protein B4915_01510 [Leucobacter massiliensis]
MREQAQECRLGNHALLPLPARDLGEQREPPPGDELVIEQDILGIPVVGEAEGEVFEPDQCLKGARDLPAVTDEHAEEGLVHA